MGNKGNADKEDNDLKGIKVDNVISNHEYEQQFTQNGYKAPQYIPGWFPGTKRINSLALPLILIGPCFLVFLL